MRVYGAVGLNSGLETAAGGATRKASGRTRRESFKPRPSMDNDWAGSSSANTDKRFAGFAGGSLPEEDEDF